MNSTNQFGWAAILWRWFVLSLLIPTFAIFARWLVNFAFAPDSVRLPEMLYESEVTFLAAVMLAETLGDAPHVGTDHACSDRLSICQMTVLAFMVLCFLMFGVFVPLTEIELVPESSSQWLIPLNAVLITISVTLSIVARLLYWNCRRKVSRVDMSQEQAEQQPTTEKASQENAEEVAPQSKEWGG